MGAVVGGATHSSSNVAAVRKHISDREYVLYDNFCVSPMKILALPGRQQSGLAFGSLRHEQARF